MSTKQAFLTQGSLAEWYQVFQLAGIVYLVVKLTIVHNLFLTLKQSNAYMRVCTFQVGAATYLLWGQAELQGWAALEKKDLDQVDDPLDTSNLIKSQPGKPTFNSDDC